MTSTCSTTLLFRGQTTMNIHPLVTFVLSLGLTENDLRTAATKAADRGWKFDLEAFYDTKPANADLMEELNMKDWNACTFMWHRSSKQVRYLLVAQPYASRGEKKIALKFLPLGKTRSKERDARLSTPYVPSGEDAGPDVDPLPKQAGFYGISEETHDDRPASTRSRKGSKRSKSR